MYVFEGRNSQEAEPLDDHALVPGLVARALAGRLPTALVGVEAAQAREMRVHVAATELGRQLHGCSHEIELCQEAPFALV
jgi:hypothetical protein